MTDGWILRDPSLSPLEGPRLSKQCAAMRDAFLAAPSMTITNDALSRISRKYTSRISDLRAAGYEIAVTQRDFRSGLTHYTMIRKP